MGKHYYEFLIGSYHWTKYIMYINCINEKTIKFAKIFHCNNLNVIFHTFKNFTVS